MEDNRECYVVTKQDLLNVLNNFKIFTALKCKDLREQGKSPQFMTIELGKEWDKEFLEQEMALSGVHCHGTDDLLNKLSKRD